MTGGGLRLQLFAALAIAVLAAAFAAAATAYHVFDRELERAVEARLKMLVAESGRVLDAGIAAGLDLDRPQLQERALYSLRPDLGAEETIAVADADGRIVASSNAAEIGELLSLATLSEALAAPTPADQPADQPLMARPLPAAAPLAASVLDHDRLVVARPIESLFGAPAGFVVARLGLATLDQPRRAFIAKLSLATAGIATAGLVVAALAAALAPWRARRIAQALEAVTGQLYAGIGGRTTAPPTPAVLPPAMRAVVQGFSQAVEAREHELSHRADAVDLLDEAA